METSLTESEGERLQSEMTQLRQLLHDSEALTRLLVDASHDAVITMDAHGRVTGWNPQAEVMFGWSREEVQGFHCPAAAPRGARTRFAAVPDHGARAGSEQAV